MGTSNTLTGNVSVVVRDKNDKGNNGLEHDMDRRNMTITRQLIKST